MQILGKSLCITILFFVITGAIGCKTKTDSSVEISDNDLASKEATAKQSQAETEKIQADFEAKRSAVANTPEAREIDSRTTIPESLQNEIPVDELRKSLAEDASVPVDPDLKRSSTTSPAPTVEPKPEEAGN
ncbi:MAG: hypothetical protein ACK5NT_03945 [Pyrinomonadaceae bacterium]